MPSPPKPWEAANAGSATSAITSPATAAGVSSLASDLNSTPDVPSRPQSLAANRPAGIV